MSDSRKILIAELTARAGCEADVCNILAEYAVHVRAEPGNQVFECYQTEGNSQRFLVYEIYTDEASFQAHLSDPMNAMINERLADVTEGGSSLTFLNAFG